MEDLQVNILEAIKPQTAYVVMIYFYSQISHVDIEGMEPRRIMIGAAPVTVCLSRDAAELYVRPGTAYEEWVIVPVPMTGLNGMYRFVEERIGGWQIDGDVNGRNE